MRPDPADRLQAVVVTVVISALGAPLGLLAAAITPLERQVLYLDAAAGYPHPVFLQAAEEDRAGFAGDGVMLAVLAGAGLLIGLAAIFARRRAPLGTVVGVIAGGLVAGLVAMAVAHVAVHGSYAGVPATAVNQTALELRPYIRGRVDFVMLPAVALLVFLTGNARWLLRQRDGQGVSSGTAASG